ncbi:MAG: adenylosuccinate lyase [Planctomycetota bacterium]|nr:adenylosuccinate lyase [Planctomycetota bacterium]
MSTSPHDEYESPLVTRYAGRGMRKLFSARHRIEAWRQLWIWLAEAERDLGLEIDEAQLAAMRDARDDIDFDQAAEFEARFRHDVMAHVHTYGEAAPEARGVIHLGATSCYVTDNADAMVIREALEQVEVSLAEAIDAYAAFAKETADVPCLAFTHFQPAQPTTVGKRACLWLQDLLSDLEAIHEAVGKVPFLGSKGTTGTQASFLALFDGDEQKCLALDKAIAEKAGFPAPVPVSGQTYPRKADYAICAALGGVAVTAHRIANDIRLLSGLRELAEPFEKEQIGSSAMAYKQNPMRSERITALARHVIALVPEAANTAAEQWLERTLDDSAARRIYLPEAFLGVDAILRLLANVGRGLHVNRAVARARLVRELPFMATEEILMRAVKAGGDRQVLHEQIRVHSLAAKDRILEGAAKNDLMERIAGDDAFAAVKDELEGLLEPERFVGLAPQQTRAFLADHVEPALAPYRSRLGADVSIKV